MGGCDIILQLAAVEPYFQPYSGPDKYLLQEEHDEDRESRSHSNNTRKEFEYQNQQNEIYQ